MRKFFRITASMLGAAAMLLLCSVAILQNRLPEELLVLRGQDIRLAGGQVAVAADGEQAVQIADAKLWGIIPLKSVTVREVERVHLVPCGRPFGIKLRTDGVMVVGYSEPEGGTKGYSPAKEAGILIGDVIQAIDGQEIHTASDVKEALRGGTGTVTVTVLRDDGQAAVQIEAAPRADTNGGRTLGLWVRDSSAGIGTMTYYNPADGQFAGLGHGICDDDTGVLLPLWSGEAVEVTICGADRGQIGRAGELFGTFHTTRSLGTLTDNTEHGVYGILSRIPAAGDPVPAAFSHEVETGKAEILTTLAGQEPQSYEIEITRIDTSGDRLRNLEIRITDAELLEITGGIVQGMSGSPIVQNGKLVGAVTHVLVNDPTRGYGILIENMLETAE